MVDTTVGIGWLFDRLHGPYEVGCRSFGIGKDEFDPTHHQISVASFRQALNLFSCWRLSRSLRVVNEAACRSNSFAPKPSMPAGMALPVVPGAGKLNCIMRGFQLEDAGFRKLPDA